MSEFMHEARPRFASRVLALKAWKGGGKKCGRWKKKTFPLLATLVPSDGIIFFTPKSEIVEVERGWVWRLLISRRVAFVFHAGRDTRGGICAGSNYSWSDWLMMIAISVLVPNIKNTRYGCRLLCVQKVPHNHLLWHILSIPHTIDRCSISFWMQGISSQNNRPLTSQCSFHLRSDKTSLILREFHIQLVRSESQQLEPRMYPNMDVIHSKA